MKALLISIFVSIIAFFLLISNDKKKAVLLIIFMLPFYYYPIENRIIHSGISIGTSGLIVIYVWLAMKLKSKYSQKYKMNWKELSPKVTSLYYFLLMGVFSGWIYLQDGIVARTSVFYKSTPSVQIINNSIFIILVILLLKILVSFQYDDLFRAKIAKIFIFTIFIQVFSQILKVLRMENILWGLFLARGTFDVEEVRNLGLFYAFGIGVYVVLIISFSLLYYNKHKFLSIAAILSAFVFSIFTGIRQTVVFMTLFYILLTFIYTLKRKISIIQILLVIFISTIFLISWNNYLSKTVVFRRFAPAISYIEQGDILAVTNRDAAGIPFVLDELKTYPILGKGSLNLYWSKYSPTNIAGHVIWFNIYKKFGIIGFIYLLTILIYPIVKLFKICIKTKNKYVLKEGAILFSLMVVVFTQQFFDNFFWFSNTMLLYGFVYFWVFSFINRQRLLNKKEKVT